MRSIKNKSLILLLAIVIILCTTAIVLASTNGHTQGEAVAWVNSLVGQSIDYDGVAGYQCVDLTKSYYAYLGQTVPTGNANTYVNGGAFIPAGWTYQSSPQPGDIAVWTSGTYGHVAIVTEIRGTQMVCVEQNYAGKSSVQPNLHNIDADKYIRPDFITDTTPPVISNVVVSDISKEGYTVTCSISDNVGVDTVKFPTWTTNNGQDDCIWHIGSYSNGKATFRVKASDHNNETGWYLTHIYVWDFAGNQAKVSQSTVSDLHVYVGDETEPTISNVVVSNVTANGYTVTCDVSDDIGIAKVEFPTWTVDGGQDDLIWHQGTVSGNKATFTVKTSDHNNETSTEYVTHIYVWDKSGNIAVVSAGKVYVANPISSVSIKYPNMYYTGKAKTQNGTTVVKAKVAGKEITLKQGTDYNISYKNNVERGTATMIVTGIGNYTGTITKTFKIVRQPLENVKPKVTITYPNMNYTGKPRTQNKYTTVTVVQAGKTITLEQGKDYKISYKNNTNVGVATMTITGIGNYTGTITKTFRIIPPKTNVTSTTKSGTQITVKWDKKTTQTTGYLLQYSTSKTFASDKHSIWIKDPSTVSRVIKNLTKGKTYYIRIRTYKEIGDTKYYSVWSDVKNLKL